MRRRICLVSLFICVQFSVRVFDEKPLLQAQGTELFKENGVVRALHYSGTSEELADKPPEPSTWSKLKGLSKITISDTRIPISLMEAVAEVQSLQSLELGREGGYLGIVEPGSLKSIERLTRLKVLVLCHYHDDLKDSDFEFLSALQSLERFENFNDVGPSTFAHLSRLPNLRQLFCWNIEAYDVDIETLSRNPNLQRIDISSISNPTALLSGLGGGIRDLRFSCHRFKESDFQQLSKLTGVEDLSIKGEFESVPLNLLSPLKKLETLYFYVKGGGHKIELGLLKSNHNLRKIGLGTPNRENRVTLSGLENHPSIEEISVSRLTITNRDLEILKAIPNLRSVVAFDSKIELEKLQLQLPNCEITLEQEQKDEKRCQDPKTKLTE